MAIQNIHTFVYLFKISATKCIRGKLQVIATSEVHDKAVRYAAHFEALLLHESLCRPDF